MTDRKRGRVKGRPLRFVHGHNARRTPEAYREDPVTGCWEWLRSRGPDGYGKTRYNGRIGVAHRAMWETHNGPIPPGLEVHHTCENRGCVNPDHMQLVSEHRHKRLHSRLTEEQVAEIRSTPRVRGSGVALAERFGVTVTVISDIRTGRTWRLQ